MSGPAAMNIEARIVREPSDWARGTVRLLIREQHGDRAAFLMINSTWQDVPEGQYPEGEVGLILPAGVVEALAEAIAEFQGHTSHADTEARVLREWLAAERARVDQVLAR